MTTDLSSKLSEYDFVVLVDASGSMSERDMPGGKSRWEYMQETVTALASDIEQFDQDGLGLVTFGGSNITSNDGVKASAVKDVFASRRAMGSTPLHLALEAGLKLAGKSDKKDFILVFTDGVPDDKKAVADIIRQASNQQETDDSLTILFVQVGREPTATEYLRKLDDELTGCKFDIVDAKTMDEVEAFSSTSAMIEAAIND